ncbi:ABC transporter substrate-binding protein [Nesterenkonia rhizosphaerae]|uniref:Extracellular solute-binding protein n=1 Tax=Nesterenkonia rhizosphaerae TaxID=1348272 RepID=A0ABP9FQM3_9MICC
MTGTKKFTRLSAAAAAVALLAVTACGGGNNAEGGGDEDSQEQVQLRFAWWGSELRQANSMAIIEAFEDEYPHISVEGEFADWAGYQDLLATQFASRDAPDIVQLDDEFIREYADRGVLLELTDIDTSDIDPTILEGGQAEGVQIAIPTGVNALVMMANPELFDEAGVELPDDTTWTWDDFDEITQTIHEETEAFGTNNPIMQVMRVWARQQGEHLFTEDGQYGLSVEQTEEWFQTLYDWSQAGTLPNASLMVEEESATMEDSLIATGRAALGTSWTNQLPALTTASGVDLVPLRMPSPTGNAEDNGLWFKNTMLIAGNAGTEHPEEVQLFIDFFINTEEAGLHNMMDRGLPINETVRAAVVDQVDAQDQVVAELIDSLGGEITDPEPMLPVGYGAISDSYTRYLQEVMFERMTPAEAAEAFVADAESNLGS